MHPDKSCQALNKVSVVKRPQQAPRDPRLPSITPKLPDQRVGARGLNGDDPPRREEPPAADLAAEASGDDDDDDISPMSQDDDNPMGHGEDSADQDYTPQGSTPKRHRTDKPRERKSRTHAAFARAAKGSLPLHNHFAKLAPPGSSASAAHR